MGWRRPADEPLRDGETRLALKSRSPAESTAASCRRGTRRVRGHARGARRPLDRGGPSPDHLILVSALPPNGHPPPKDVIRTCKLFRIVGRFNVYRLPFGVSGSEKTSLALNGSLWRRLSPLVCAFFFPPFRLSHPATFRRRCGAAALLAPAVLLAAASRSWPGRAGVPRQAFISAIAVEHPSRLPGIARLPTNSRADRWRLRRRDGCAVDAGRRYWLSGSICCA